MKVSAETYSWMQNALVSTPVKDETGVFLGQLDVDRLKTGNLLGTLLSKKLLKGSKSLADELKTNGANPQVYWTTIGKVLAKIGLVLEKYVKNGLEAGDEEAYAQVLNLVRDFELFHDGFDSILGVKWVVSLFSDSFSFSAKKILGLISPPQTEVNKLFTKTSPKTKNQVKKLLVEACLRVSSLASCVSGQEQWLALVLVSLSGSLFSTDTAVVWGGLKFYWELYTQLKKKGQSVMKEWLIDSGVYIAILKSMRIDLELTGSLLANLPEDSLGEICFRELPDLYIKAEGLALLLKIIEKLEPRSRFLCETLEVSLKDQVQFEDVAFLCDFWLRQPFPVEHSSANLSKTLHIIDTYLEKSPKSMKILILGRLFAVLEAHRTSCLLQYITNFTITYINTRDIREFCLQNFTLLITSNTLLDFSKFYATVPRLACKIQLNSFDFDFFLAASQTLSSSEAFKFLDMLFYAYFDTNSLAALKPITKILGKYLKLPEYQQYLTKTIDSLFALLIQRFSSQTPDETFLIQFSALLKSIGSLKHRQINKNLLTNLIFCTKKLSSVPMILQELLDLFRKKSGMPTTSEKILPSQRVLTQNSEKPLQFSSKHRAKTLSEDRYTHQTLSTNQFATKHSVLHSPISEEISLLEIEEESIFDQSLIYLVLKRFSKVTRALYTDYTSSKRTLTPGSFHRPASMALGEACKMLRDNNITTKLIPTEAVRKIFVLVTAKYQSAGLTYESFLNFLYQIAAYVYSKSPLILTQFPAAISLKALFKSIAHSGKYSLNSFTPVNDDPQLVAHLNNKLAGDKDYKLPQGYKRKTEQVLTVEYSLPSDILRTATVVCLEIVDSLLGSAFRFHIIEPIITVNTVYKAVPVPQPLLIPKASKNAVQLTPNLKHCISKLSTLYPHDLLIECAKVIDDLIQTTDKNSHILYTRNPEPLPKNKFFLIKSRAKEEFEHNRAKSEVRRRQRASELLQSLKSRQQELNRRPTERLLRNIRRKQVSSPLPSEKISKVASERYSLLAKPPQKQETDRALELIYSQALSDPDIIRLSQEYDYLFALMLKQYSTGFFLSPLHCSRLAKDLKLVPALITSYGFNQLVVSLHKKGGITKHKLHNLFLKLALTIRQQLEVHTQKVLSSYKQTYEALLEYLKFPQEFNL